MKTLNPVQLAKKANTKLRKALKHITTQYGAVTWYRAKRKQEATISEIVTPLLKLPTFKRAPTIQAQNKVLRKALKHLQNEWGGLYWWARAKDRERNYAYWHTLRDCIDEVLS